MEVAALICYGVGSLFFLAGTALALIEAVYK